MAKPQWPAEEKRTLIGKRISRIDGPVKATGTAKYSFDINRPGMLWAKLVTSPYARADVVSVDLSAAQAMPGVKVAWKDDNLIGKEVQYAGQIVAAVAAITEEIAKEAAGKVKVEYKPKQPQVVDSDPSLFNAETDKVNKKEANTVDDAFGKADIVSSGEYGIPVITHCCLESHGQVAEVRDSELYLWPSTQSISRYADRSISDAVDIPQNKTHAECQHMGGGFGSKFNPGKWGTISALLAKQSGKPVKLMLERDIELMTAGNRPSAYAKIQVGASKDGTVTAVDPEVRGT